MKNVLVVIAILLSGCGLAPAGAPAALSVNATVDPGAAPVVLASHTYRVELNVSFNGGFDFLEAFASIITIKPNTNDLQMDNQLCYPADCNSQLYLQIPYNGINHETYVVEITTTDDVFVDVGTKNGASTNAQAKIYKDGIQVFAFVGAGALANAEQRYHILSGN